ncbi:hypothetical protein HNR46_001488 [Haloferula luteola]|uniref:PA14 domain-containing protein n=1 Tax=Haloferula luteola TaxID=595692 RepID=A0A840UZQ6_9BACT|nr:hypothetical protein [Haloferula luteola]MBB5351252.1 hypothetical protein [Haloferula luteola]
MSLHAELTQEAQQRLHAQQRNATITSMVAAFLLLVLVGLILGFIFIRPLIQPVEVLVSYSTPTSNEDSVEQKKMTNRVQQKPSSPSSASAAKVIAANVAAPTSVPVPEFDAEISEDFGASSGFGDDWGSGGFTDGGGAGGGGGGMFGSPHGPGLAGTFYDLKQDPQGKPTDMRPQDFEKDGSFQIEAPVNHLYDEEMNRAVRRNLASDALAGFFAAPRQLRLTQLYIPRIEAAEAPKAFEIGDKVQGRRWGIIYRGSVVPPEDGKFRFVGFADDVLVVLANGREALDGSLKSPLRGAERRHSFQQEFTPGGWQTFEGRWLTVKKGVPIELAILTGERPGGHYSGYLLIEKDGAEYAKDALGARKLPLFKMLPSEMPDRGPILPSLGQDTSWSIWPTQG